MEFDIGNIVFKLFHALINQGSEQQKQRQSEVHQEQFDLNQPSDLNSVGSKTELSVEAAIQGKPKRYMIIISQLYISDYGCRYVSLPKCNFVID